MAISTAMVVLAGFYCEHNFKMTKKKKQGGLNYWELQNNVWNMFSEFFWFFIFQIRINMFTTRSDENKLVKIDLPNIF